MSSEGYITKINNTKFMNDKMDKFIRLIVADRRIRLTLVDDSCMACLHPDMEIRLMHSVIFNDPEPRLHMCADHLDEITRKLKIFSQNGQQEIAYLD